MTRKTTGVALEIDLVTKINRIRGDLIKDTGKTWTFSETLNLIMAIGVGNYSKSQFKKYVDTI